MANETKYVLKLDSQQAKILVEALDIYSRIGTGQFEMLTDPLRFTGTTTPEKINEARPHLDAIKGILFNLTPNGSNSIVGLAVHKNFRIAFDIECVVRQVIATTEKHQSTSVWYDNPLHCEANVPLAKCKVKIKKDDYDDDDHDYDSEYIFGDYNS